ncbi:MAG: hypothetical protein WBJ21_07910 [Burkholderiaceae bacterium]
MTPIHLDPDASIQGSSLIEKSSSKRQSLFSVVRWGAVLAGVIVGASIQFSLALLGIASGLSLSHVAAGETLGTMSLLWAGVSMLLSIFGGAYVAARMSGFKRKIDGILHGVVTWAVASLLMLILILASVAGSSLLNVLSGSVSLGVGTMAQSDRSGGVLGLLSEVLGKSVNVQTLKNLQEQIAAGHRQEAIAVMRDELGVSADKAAAVVDQALILSGSPAQASPEGRQAADNAMRRASMVAWFGFAAIVLSLALSAFGGALGAMGAKRLVWSEESGSITAITSP